MKKILIVLFLSAFVAKSDAQISTAHYGVTTNGGTMNGGLIYKTDANGNNYQVKYEFPGNGGNYQMAGQLCRATNGKYYGCGVENFYEFDPATNVVTTKFSWSIGMNRAINGGPMQASNGKIYATSTNGGTLNKGFLFEYDIPTNTYSVILNFGPGTGSDGCTQLLETTNGRLYGASDGGTIFEYNFLTGVFTKLADFIGTNGSYPVGNLVLAPNGKIYGTTQFGGASNDGVIFSFDTSTYALINVFDFSGPDGSAPGSGMVMAPNNKMYGTTNNGGANSGGTIFEFDYTTNTFVSKFSMTGATGVSNAGGLFLAANNKFYGLAQYGGTSGNGTIYEYDYINNTVTDKYDFTSYFSGYSSYNTFVQDPNGKMFAAINGGPGDGIIGEFDTIAGYTVRADMRYSENGRNPNELVYYNNAVYGTTAFKTYHSLAQSVNSTLIKYDLGNGQLTKMWDLDMVADGDQPTGKLLLLPTNIMVGVCLRGGNTDDGTLFEYDDANIILTKKVDFDFNTSGNSPSGSLCRASNAKVYGTCVNGGLNGQGTLFEYNPANGVFVKRIDFNGALKGAEPEGIVAANNNKMYGVTKSGGTNNLGCIYEFNPTGLVFTKKIDFNGTLNGAAPEGQMIQATNNKLYGVTRLGGVNNKGTLFEYNFTSNTITKLVDFDSLNTGSYPNCTLLQGLNGKIYGADTSGGAFNKGIVFEYNILTSTFTKKHDLTGTDGAAGMGMVVACAPNLIAGVSQTACLNSTIQLGGIADSGFVYSWSPAFGLNNTTLSNPILTVQNLPHTYTVTASIPGCYSQDSVTITPILPMIPNLCMVTVDSISKNNILYWDKTLYSGVDSFYVYRDTANNNYACIGKVPYDSLSAFIDTVRTLYAANGDPNVSSWRYKIAIKDSCGNVGIKSPYHQTMFFQNSSGNFSWNHYQIEGQITPVPALSNYRFKRDDISNGTWATIQLLSASSIAYTDPSYGTYVSTGSWRVETQWSVLCNPTLKLSPQAMAAVSKSRSNVQNNFAVTGINTITEKDFVLMPNPANDFIVIQSRSALKNVVVVEIYDVTGRIVISSSSLPTTQSSIQVNTSNLSNGIYSVRIISDGGKVTKKLVIEK